MTTEIVIIASAVLTCAFFAFFYLRKHFNDTAEIARLKSYYMSVIKSKSDYALILVDMKTALEERVKELEDGVKKTFGVSVRQEITKVECIFDKVEMAFLMAGVYKLLNDEKSTIDDKEFYIKLYKKIQESIDQMEEEVEDGN